MSDLIKFCGSTLGAINFYQQMVAKKQMQSLPLSEFYRRNKAIMIPECGSYHLGDHEGVAVIEYCVGAGSYIPGAIEAAHTWALHVANYHKADSFIVLLNVNGVVVPVSACSSVEESKRYFELAMEESRLRYLASPEYEESRKRNALRVEHICEFINRLFEKAASGYFADEKTRDVRALAWTISLAKYNDHVEVPKVVRAEIGQILSKLGYKANDALGHTAVEYVDDIPLAARYVVGQAISVTADGMPVHPKLYYYLFLDTLIKNQRIASEVEALLVEAEAGLSALK